MSKRNKWILYWSSLMTVNLFALSFSAYIKDYFSCALSGFMFLFCGLALNEVLNRIKNEKG